MNELGRRERQTDIEKDAESVKSLKKLMERERREREEEV